MYEMHHGHRMSLEALVFTRADLSLQPIAAVSECDLSLHCTQQAICYALNFMVVMQFTRIFILGIQFRSHIEGEDNSN